MQTTPDPYNNKNLFSVHYLDERLKESDEWSEEEKAKAAYDKIKDIYEKKKERIQTYTDNEAQLEEDFIRPVLRVIGHVFGVQATIQRNAKRPDYGFFKSDEDMSKAFKNKDSIAFYKRAIAVGDAKAWDKDLDKKVGGKDIFENQNPSYQIDYYLRTTQPKWGILTNGRKWRLYFEESPQPIGTYYEVDLVRILENDNFEGFKFFYLFFRKRAFTPIGDSFLGRIYNQSLKYAEKIGENLEDNVYKALLWMAKGYFGMHTNKLEKNKENIKIVHDNSLIFLYRLLFLFYAESKGMLGTEVPPRYANEYSFAKWVEDILDDVNHNKVNPKGGLYNHRLFSIFKLVREGSEAMGIPREEFHIPAYNGGLFDNEKHPFLKDKKIQDGYIAKVVDLLARVPSEEHRGRSRIDYSDLSLRHLGGIYEGLLEFKPKLADQDMVAVKKKGTLKWIPASKAKKDFGEFDEDKRVCEGELYLATDKGERKATGSYYTPDYIVEYIVKNTVGPVIEDKLRDAETNEEKREAILDMKVLDPAMGSGHFLIEAMDFLANKLTRYIEKGEEKERDIDWAKRKVARNCIYGVDINPLATELAKVALWLNTMAEDKPLSFLDHHLKTGNSLIGADIHKLGKHPEVLEEETKKTGQLALSGFFGKDVRNDIKELLGIYKEMLEIVEERPEDIREQEELFREFENHPFKKKFNVLADVKTSYYFDNAFSKKQYEKLLDAFRSNDENWRKITREDWVKKASDGVPDKLEDNLSDEKRLFHWKLEFPEIFFDIKKGIEEDNPGFDVVAGNPPYLQKKSFSLTEKEFVLKQFPENTSNVNLATVFMTQARHLTRKSGFHSFIVPKSLLFTKAWEGDRRRLLPNLLRICDVSKAWQEVLLEQVIYVWQNRYKPTNRLFIDICESENITPGNPIEKNVCKFIGAVPSRFMPQMEGILERTWKNGEDLSKHAELPCGLPYQKKLKDRGDLPAIGGSEVWRYQERGLKGYLNKEDVKNDTKFIKKLENPHVILQRIVAHILEPKDHIEVAGTVNTSGKIPVNTLVCVFTKKESELSPYFLCAWFNSQFYSWYAYNFVFSRAIRSMDLYEYFATKVPVPEIIFETHETAREELLDKFTGIYLEELQKESLERTLSFISELEKTHRDVIHDILVYLAKKMIEVNQKKQDKINDFFIDLEGTVDSSFWETLQKGKQGHSLYKIESCCPYVREGSYTTYHLEDALEWDKAAFKDFVKVLAGKVQNLSDILKIYDKHAPEVKEFKKRLDGTGRTIDALVFKLYDLNEDKVKVVLDSLGTEKEIKQDILGKFKELK